MILKKKNSKKWYRLLASGVLVVGLLAGCSDTADVNDSEEVVAEVAAETDTTAPADALEEKPEAPEGTEEGEMPALPEAEEEGGMPALPEGGEEGEMPAMPEGGEEGEMPALPEGTEEGEIPTPPEGVEEGSRPEGGKGGHHHNETPNEAYTSGTRIALDGSVTYNDGTYTGEATGYKDGLTVSIVIESNTITSITITGHNETPGFYENAVASVPEAIISTQTTDVDTVSGATRTSEGIIVAVENALAKAVAE